MNEKSSELPETLEQCIDDALYQMQTGDWEGAVADLTKAFRQLLQLARQEQQIAELEQRIADLENPSDIQERER